jgi:chromate transporter
MIHVLLELFFSFFKIGLFTFGGGYAMVPMIQEEVLANGWLSGTSLSLIDFIAISESTPGPFAINMATFIGMSEGGIPGAIVATLGVVMPSFVIILLIAKFFSRFSTNPVVLSVMKGIRPVIVGILLSVMLSFVFQALFDSEVLQVDFGLFDYLALIIFVIIFLLSHFVRKISPIFLIVISAVLGILLYGII